MPKFKPGDMVKILSPYINIDHVYTVMDSGDDFTGISETEKSKEIYVFPNENLVLEREVA